MDNKKALEKLIKIVANQQTIITKLAQMGSQSLLTHTADVSAAVVPYLQQAAQAVGAKTAYNVKSASLSADGGLHVEIVQPKDADVSEYYSVKNKLKELLAGKSLKSADGRDLPVKMINVIGMTA